MRRLSDVCRYVRSKNAGPFWVTFDLFFDTAASYQQYADDPAIGAEAVAKIYGVEPSQVRRFAIDSLNVVKLSLPRTTPQGGALERDMHSGQQYVRLLDIALG